MNRWTFTNEIEILNLVEFITITKLNCEVG